MSSLPSDTAFLNSNHHDDKLPAESDVVVIGAGIHSLIYAIHTKKIQELRVQNGEEQTSPSVTVIEQSGSPGYKIGESTLTVFGVWLKTIGIDSPILWRLFGPKDGLAFYYFREGGDPEDYSNFTANGPPADFVPTLQVERKISELLLTLYAQRNGVKVLHGRSVDVGTSQLSDERSTLQIRNTITSAQEQIKTKLVIDATGRFRRFASKGGRLQRFEGFNTNAFWAYFECPGDESEIPLKHYESVNTNHICIKEGWAWVIRLPTWEGSSIPNLAKMINFLLDLNERKTPADEIPSVRELSEMFDLKFRYVVSIGFALRSDVEFPPDLSAYGTSEAEKKFNWIISRYPKIQGLMDKHVLLRDLYGLGTSWFVRKTLTYQSPQVMGQGWVAIGDAVGFTNPLYSPGINANMSTSVLAANLTNSYISAPDPTSRAAVLIQYDRFCSTRIPNLHRLNVFNYLCMRSPKLGPLGPLWTYICGTGNTDWQQIRAFKLQNVHKLLMNWDWGAGREEFISFAEKVIPKLQGLPTEPSEELIQEVLAMSAVAVREVIATGKYKSRWAGLLRWYDDDLNFHADKPQRDILARRCESCRNWRMLRPDMRLCPTCGFKSSVQLCNKVLVDELVADVSQVSLLQMPKDDFKNSVTQIDDVSLEFEGLTVD